MPAHSSPAPSNNPELELFHPRDKGRWQKLGVAFRNKDGSLSIVLEYLPIGGVDGQVRIVAQPYESREAREAREANANANNDDDERDDAPQGRDSSVSRGAKAGSGQGGQGAARR